MESILNVIIVIGVCILGAVVAVVSATIFCALLYLVLVALQWVGNFVGALFRVVVREMK